LCIEELRRNAVGRKDISALYLAEYFCESARLCDFIEIVSRSCYPYTSNIFYRIDHDFVC
jgi:hypothetical protein